MTNINSINWDLLRNQLQEKFVDEYKTIWLDYSRLGSVCITAFPKNPIERYRIFTAEKLNKIDLETLINIMIK